MTRMPKPGNFSPGTQPKPTLNDFSRGMSQLDRMPGQVRREVSNFNNMIQRLTMPYGRAAELRAGNAPVQQRDKQIADELKDTIPFPAPRAGGVPGGRLLDRTRMG